MKETSYIKKEEHPILLCWMIPPKIFVVSPNYAS